uniref:Uncharacterized protein n=1 Tax=Tetranychus urticae TaxID=32264 RepID=T1L5T5_TETUR
MSEESSLSTTLARPMARTKQTRRRAPSSSLVAASGLPLALRENVNFGNIDEEHAAGLEATAEKQVCVDESSLIPMEEEESLEAESALDEEDADDDEPESEGAKVSPEEWAKEPTEEELTKFATMPVANYDFKCVVGSGYLPGQPRVMKNFRYELAHYNTLNTPSQLTGYTGPIPEGFTQDIPKLQDCGNPRHFIDDITEKYHCRWCGHNFSKSSNKVRHEKGCGIIGAPGHKCDIHCHNIIVSLLNHTRLIRCTL